MLTEGDRTLELFHENGSMHNAGMLIVYFPKEKILEEADDYTPDEPERFGARGDPARCVYCEFAEAGANSETRRANRCTHAWNCRAIYRSGKAGASGNG